MPDSRYTPPMDTPGLTPEHARRLQTLRDNGFTFQLFPLFPGFVGARKDDCAALLQPRPGGVLAVGAQPGFLVEGNISVKVEKGGEEWFVWKQHQVAATTERQQQLRQFTEELESLLGG